MTNYFKKYNKYKSKYIALKKNIYGGSLTNVYVENIETLLIDKNKIGNGTFGYVYKDDKEEYALKLYKTKKNKRKIREENKIVNTMSKNNIGPKYIGTVIINTNPKKYIELDESEEPESEKSESDKFKYIIITELYDSDLKIFLKKKILLNEFELDLKKILSDISELILNSLNYYVCSDIKFNNILIKKINDDISTSKYKVVLTDFDGEFCKITETSMEQQDKEMILKLVQLLLFMSSFEILKYNSEKNIHNYVYNLDINNLKPFYYDILCDFFNDTNKKQNFFDFLKRSLYKETKYRTENELENIILEILTLIHLLKIKDKVGFNNEDPRVDRILFVLRLYNDKIAAIDIFENLIEFFFKQKNLTGGVIAKINNDLKYDNLKPISEGTYSNIYYIDDKIHKVIKEDIHELDLNREVSIYDEYMKKNIGVPIDSYFFVPQVVNQDVGQNPTGKSGYIMDKYDNDLENFFTNYDGDNDKLSSYEIQITNLIDEMFQSNYICGDIKFKNMLIKNEQIVLTDFDYKFCFDNKHITEENIKLYAHYIYFSLLCLLYMINVSRLKKLLEELLDLTTRDFYDFKSHNIEYVYLFYDKIEFIKNCISNNKFLTIKTNQLSFFMSQFHYIYFIYCLLTDKPKIDYNTITDHYITNVFEFISRKLFKTKKIVSL